MYDHYQDRAEKIAQRISRLAAITEEPGIIKRTYGTKAFTEAGRQILSWMQEAGLEARIDNIGNVRGRWACKEPSAKTLLVGSHYDTVINAGAFDGPLGILVGLDMLEHIIQSNASLPFHIELLAFCDEEGVRFHTAYLGSKAVAGSFDAALLNKTDKDGISLKEAIQKTGGDPDQVRQDVIAAEKLLGYFEVHIEQGPVLYEAGIPVAVVTAIAGQKRMALLFTGEAGHAGTVPMHMRRDALCCAAVCITEIESFALAHKDTIVATVGMLGIPDAASNVIPGQVSCTLDIRSVHPEDLAAAWLSLNDKLAGICRQRDISFGYETIQESAPVACDAGMRSLLKQSILKAGYSIVELVSGAGHDVVPLSAVCPVCMLFVRCYKGISHHPQENVETEDIAAAIKVAHYFTDLVTSSGFVARINF